MRVLFLSDTHLGFDSPARPRVERRRRGGDFFRNYELALAPALRREVDVVLHGGDLLYRSRVPASLAERALAPLVRVAEAGVAVLLVPGNHERGRIPYPLLAWHPNLHVFDRPRTVSLEARGVRVAFVGFPYAKAVRSRFRGLVAQAGRANGATEKRGRADHAILCLHHSIEGATCGPGDFTFRAGDDVIRRADLPRGLTLVLSGHVHRHQVMRPGTQDGPTVVYAGSIERTSFAEAPEAKGVVRVELDSAGVTKLEFSPLPTRPMLVRALSLQGCGEAEARRRIAEVVRATPPDAVLQIRVEGEPAAAACMSAAALREVAGARNVALVGAWTAARRRERSGEPRAAEGDPQLGLFDDEREATSAWARWRRRRDPSRSIPSGRRSAPSRPPAGSRSP